MIKRADSFLFAVFILFALVVTSCTQQRSPCYEPKIVSVAIGTYRMSDTVAVDSVLENPDFFCLDTPLSQLIVAGNKFTALLSPFVDSTRWRLIPDLLTDSTDGTPIEMYDTITFYHTKQLNFISNACGYAYYFTLDGVKTTYNSIDSIVIINNSVDNNASTQHVKIFY